ncbi:MAG: antitoxin VapB family protein [Candidatus Micrarchaeota archaeon]|nr:antitoxin VapB family protein [Candidatus Micrarchaeota archaeon]
MRTIMIKDTVYKRLAEIKGGDSFSETIDRILSESRSARKAKLAKFFGTMSSGEAAKMQVRVKKIRQGFKSRQFG